MEPTDHDNRNGVQYPALPSDNLYENIYENSPADNTQEETKPTTQQESEASFWEVNNYKRTVRRVDDGAKLCDDFMKMVSERAEIEALYAAKLQAWSRKWLDLLNKGPEYGSCKDSWVHVTSEAEQVAQVHINLQSTLLSRVHESVAAWKGANYHKSLLSWKETKNAEEGFSKAQRPWAKRYDDVLKSKKAYYAACRAKDQAEKLYNSSDPNTMKEDQIKKTKEKLMKSEREVSTTQDKYKEAVRDITNYNPKYKEDMCFVFDKLQAFEGERKAFFKQTMQGLCNALNVQQYFERFTQIYNELSNKFEKTEPTADLGWWASTYGTDMPIKWPEYEDYVAFSDLGQETDAQTVSESSKTKSVVCTTL